MLDAIPRRAGRDGDRHRLLHVGTVLFKRLYVLVFVSHARRELVDLNVTASPTAAWVWRQLIAATPTH